MKAVMKKISNVLKVIFGYGIMLCLFGGGLTFFGYVAALCIGGETAALICAFISDTFIPIIVYASTCLILLGLIAMYFAGEKALSSEKKKRKGKKEAAETAEVTEAAEK